MLRGFHTESRLINVMAAADFSVASVENTNNSVSLALCGIRTGGLSPAHTSAAVFKAVEHDLLPGSGWEGLPVSGGCVFLRMFRKK